MVTLKVEDGPVYTLKFEDRDECRRYKGSRWMKNQSRSKDIAWIVDEYCRLEGVKVEKIWVYYNGKLIEGGETADSLNMPPMATVHFTLCKPTTKTIAKSRTKTKTPLLTVTPPDSRRMIDPVAAEEQNLADLEMESINNSMAVEPALDRSVIDEKRLVQLGLEPLMIMDRAEMEAEIRSLLAERSPYIPKEYERILSTSTDRTIVKKLSRARKEKYGMEHEEYKRPRDEVGEQIVLALRKLQERRRAGKPYTALFIDQPWISALQKHIEKDKRMGRATNASQTATEHPPPAAEPAMVDPWAPPSSGDLSIISLPDLGVPFDGQSRPLLLILDILNQALRRYKTGYASLLRWRQASASLALANPLMDISIPHEYSIPQAELPVVPFPAAEANSVDGTAMAVFHAEYRTSVLKYQKARLSAILQPLEEHGRPLSQLVENITASLTHPSSSVYLAATGSVKTALFAVLRARLTALKEEAEGAEKERMVEWEKRELEYREGVIRQQNRISNGPITASRAEAPAQVVPTAGMKRKRVDEDEESYVEEEAEEDEEISRPSAPKKIKTGAAHSSPVTRSMTREMLAKKGSTTAGSGKKGRGKGKGKGKTLSGNAVHPLVKKAKQSKQGSQKKQAAVVPPSRQSKAENMKYKEFLMKVAENHPVNHINKTGIAQFGPKGLKKHYLEMRKLYDAEGNPLRSADVV